MTTISLEDEAASTEPTAQVLRGLPELATRIGSRARNNDATTWAMNTTNPGDPFLIAAIADGVGAPAGSGVAARAAVQTACAVGMYVDVRFEMAHLAEAVTEVLVSFPTWNGPSTDALGAALHEFANPDSARDHQPADTTFVGLTADADAELHVCWLGDSRAYVLTEGTRLVRLTDDHNRGCEGFPNQLTRALGWRDAVAGRAETARWTSTTGPDRADRVLLCTDGVHGPLTERAIRYALIHARTSAQAAVWLTSWAVRAAGGRADNATALVFELAPNPDAPTYDREARAIDGER